MKLVLSNKGFTLIELLIVIVIVALLSTIGVVVFANAQKQARDARRITDIDAIVQALEGNMTSDGYQPLANTQFSSGVPYDPRSTNVVSFAATGCGNPGSANENSCWYCLKGDRTTHSYCNPRIDHYLNNDAFLRNSSRWVVCANLELGSPAYYCKRNTQ